MSITLELYNNVPFEYEVTVTVTETSLPLDITGATILLKMRPSLDSDTVLLDASTTNGYITITDGANGKFLISPPLVVTDTIEQSGTFDILLITADNKYYIIGKKGKIKYMLLNTRA